MVEPAQIIQQTELIDEAQKEYLKRLVESCGYFSPRDRSFHLSQIEEGITTEEKINFYMQAAQLREEILQNVSAHKRPIILNQINAVLDESLGESRGLKLQRLEEIGRAIRDFQENKTLLRHKLFRTQNLPGGLGNDVLKVLMAEDEERFHHEYELVFTPKFWGRVYGLFSRDYPNVVKSFAYKTEEDFLKTFTSLDELPGFLINLKSAAEKDVKESVKSFFSAEKSKKYLDRFSLISSKDPDKIVDFLHFLCKEKEKNKGEAREIFAWAEKLALQGKLKEAKSEIEIIQKRFGKNAIKELGLHGFIGHLALDLEAEEKAEKKKAVTKKQKTERLLGGIEACLAQKDFSGADILVDQLKKWDEFKAASEKKRITKIKEEDAKPNEAANDNEGNLENVSMEKKLKIEFLERSREHMHQVIEMCKKLGVPEEDPKYWGVEGIRNRVKILRDMGKYDLYKGFNDDDPHVPSTEQAGGFKFRWLDLRTGPNLTRQTAESGIGFLKQFKEGTGYELAVLAGAFSVNWKNPDDPVFTPGEMLSKIEGELTRVKGQGIDF